MENVRIHGSGERPAKEKQKLRAAKIVYKDGIKPEGHKKKKNTTTPQTTKQTRKKRTQKATKRKQNSPQNS